MLRVHSSYRFSLIRHLHPIVLSAKLAFRLSGQLRGHRRNNTDGPKSAARISTSMFSKSHYRILPEWMQRRWGTNPSEQTLEFSKKMMCQSDIPKISKVFPMIFPMISMSHSFLLIFMTKNHPKQIPPCATCSSLSEDAMSVIMRLGKGACVDTRAVEAPAWLFHPKGLGKNRFWLRKQGWEKTCFKKTT